MSARSLRRFVHTPWLLAIVALFLGGGTAVDARHTAIGASCQSNGSGGGDWDNPATWINCGGGTPGADDDVTIATGDTVTIPSGDRTINQLTLNGGLSSTPGTLAVRGDWAGTGDFTHNGGTVRFDGSAPQTITNSRTGASRRFHHIVVDGALSTLFNVELSGNLTVSSGGSFTPGATIDFALVSAKTLACHGTCRFQALIVRTVDASGSSQPVQVASLNVTTTGGTFTAPPQLIVDGDMTVSGTFLPGTGAVIFRNDTAPQSIGGSGNVTFYHLAVENGSSTGLALGRDLLVDGTLTLGGSAVSAGRLTTGSRILTLGPAATVVAGSGTLDSSRMIVAGGTGAALSCNGQLRKQFTAPGAFLFPIGAAAAGGSYSPVEVAFTGGSFGAGAFAGACVTNAKHPNNGSVLSYIDRYWTLTADQVSSFLADVTFTYVDADVNGTESVMVGGKWDGALPWTQLNGVDATANSFDGTVSSFGDFTAGEPTALPITLAAFRADRHGETVHFTWQTAVETANAGFNLFVATPDGRRPINADLIPSTAYRALEPQSYQFEARLPAGDTFYVEAVDVREGSSRFGPFELGRDYGRAVQLEPVDWPAIRAGHAARAAARQADLARQRPEGLASGPQAQLRLAVSGLYRVGHADLVAAGVDLTGADPAGIALTAAGVPVPVTLVTAGATFAPGDYFEFYGQALDTLYTKTNVYTLHLDPALARRTAVDATPPDPAPAPFYLATLTNDANLLYDVAASGDDPWYLARLVATSGPITWTFTLNTPDYVVDAAPASLLVDLWGGSQFAVSPDHHVRISLNGVLLADETFDGLTRHLVDVSLPPGLLQPGANTLAIALPHDLGLRWDIVGLEAYHLTYPRAFVAEADALTFHSDAAAFVVTGFTSPEIVAYRLEGETVTRLASLAVTANGGSFDVALAGAGHPATYVVTTAAKLGVAAISPARPVVDISSGTAEYLMLAHPDFVAGLEPLASFHRGRGLDVRIVDVDDVYDQFGAGRFDPAAIAAYLQHAAANMGIAYVLLVGGDTYDYHDYLGVGSVSFIPSIYAATGPVAHFAPVDPAYVDFDGDGVPDLPIGRFPVRTPAELQLMVDKTLAYAARSSHDTAVFAADAGFADYGEGLALYLPADWTIARAYLDQMPVATARSLLIDRLNAGVALGSFFGHSGPTAWTFAGLFNNDDAAALTNSDPLLVAQFGCWNNYYVLPGYNTLGHRFLLSGSQGAAAVLGAATLTDAASDMLLGDLALARLSQPGARIGQAVQQAKMALAAAAPGLLDVQYGYTLLGDPALVMVPGTPTAVTHLVAHSPAPPASPGWSAAGALLALTVATLWRRARRRPAER